MRRANKHHANQGGQALTEFVVVGLFVLVPLFLIIPVVAKLISQKQDVEVAARYAAWERTVWYQDTGSANLSGYHGYIPIKSDAQVAREIDSRLFARDIQPITSDGDVDYQLDPFSRRQNGQLNPLLQQNTQAGNKTAYYTAQTASQSSLPGFLAGLTNDFFDAVGGVTRFKLNTKGLFDAQVSVNIANLTGVFGLNNVNLDNLALSAHNVLFAESWAAGGTQHAQYLVSGLLPQQYLDNNPVSEFQDIISSLPIADELASDCLDIGHTDLEPVPAHRLTRISGGEQGSGATQCHL